MKYYIIAGEASGDLHGSNLIKELKKLDAGANVRCWGGDMMQAAGATLVKHYKELAFMGFAEVLLNMRTILKNIRFCKTDIQAYKPDVLVFIDYPGFNLRIAEWAKPLGYKTAFYISPQIWAWKENRIHSIKKHIDKMMVILPFEKAFYAKWNYEVDYVGHPLVEVVEQFMRLNPPANKTGQVQRTVAILPGSRKQEILKKLPIMLRVTAHYPELRFVVAKAPSLEESFYAPLLSNYSNVHTVENKTYALLSEADAAMVTSGTATLETALFKVPEVICYKGSPISYAIAKRLIKIKFIGLVNLVMSREVVKELIQHELTEKNLQEELDTLLHDQDKIARMKNDYEALWNLLRQGGHASANAAAIIYKMIA